MAEVLRLPGAKAGMTTFFCYCALESTLGLWGATYISQVRGVNEATAASFGAMFYMGITIGRAISGFAAMKLLPKQMVRLGEGLLAVGCVMMMIPAGSTLSGLGLVVCGLGCAPIYPNIIQDTPVNYCLLYTSKSGKILPKSGTKLPSVLFKTDKLRYNKTVSVCIQMVCPLGKPIISRQGGFTNVCH